MTTRGRLRTVSMLLVASLATSSCALLKGAPAPLETYELTAPQTFPALRTDSSSQILIKLPVALKALDSERIVLRPSPKVITYVAGAQYSDSLPRTVQAKLVEAFENSGAFGATARPGDGLVIDYQLIGDIRKFEIAGNAAVLEISIKLLSDKTGQVRETRIFTATAAARGSTADAYVDALDRAFDATARDIVTWVARST